VRLGLLGPADGDAALFRQAAEAILRLGAEAVVYLGIDGAADAAVSKWAEELAPGVSREDAFLGAAAELAARGTAQDLEALLARDAAAARLSVIRKVPAGAVRAIEMIDDRIVTLVHDKAVLDEEDIANATLVVYGKAPELVLKRFGPRWFFSPGPLAARRAGLVEVDEDGHIVVSIVDPTGGELSREILHARPSGRMMVVS
jgi:hypothetical protein